MSSHRCQKYRGNLGILFRHHLSHPGNTFRHLFAGRYEKNQIDWFEIETGTLYKSNMACWKITNLLRCFSINHKDIDIYIYIHAYIYIYIHIAIKLICLITPVCLLDYSKQQTDAEKGLQGSCSMMFAEQFPGSWLFGIVLRVPCNQTNLNRTYRGSQ